MTNNDHAEMPLPVIGGDWVEASYRMKSGYNNPDKTYDIAIGKSGAIWLYEKDVAQPLYVSGGQGSRGFGGSELTFKLRDSIAGSITLKGPWASNSDAFFADTGIDVRDKYWTFVVISRYRFSYYDPETGKYDGRLLLSDVLYRDEGPQQGTFDRGKDIARKLANQLGHPVCLHSSSYGGSSCGFEKPDGWSFEDENNWFTEVHAPVKAAYNAKMKAIHDRWLIANPPPPPTYDPQPEVEYEDDPIRDFGNSWE